MRIARAIALGMKPEDCYLYKKDAPEAPEQKIVTPTAPIEEAGVELDEDDDKNKTTTGKKSLKMPTTPVSSDTGLKI